MTAKYFFKRYSRILIGGTMLAVILFAAVFAPLLTDYDPTKTDVFNQGQDPGPEHLLGTDTLGRDVYARLIYGGRVSLAVGLAVGLIALAIGTMLGLVSGYYTKADKFIMRVMDGLSAFPSTVLALLMLSVTKGGMGVLIIAITITSIPGKVRLVRSIVLSVKEDEHVEAAKSMGASDMRIMLQYILPLCVSPLLISFTGTVAAAIISESTLSFLGIGIPPTIPTWGNMLSDGRTYIFMSPHMLYAPGIAIVLTVFAVNMIGDGLRDILDPRLKT